MADDNRASISAPGIPVNVPNDRVPLQLFRWRRNSTFRMERTKREIRLYIHVYSANRAKVSCAVLESRNRPRLDNAEKQVLLGSKIPLFAGCLWEGCRVEFPRAPKLWEK